ncbi:uncharacterized protein [Amphiura filiformis]|uniref:uncharacterized protein n=1 Tax=Amphiura filiformis TaxID=82378 RepID=UPI003B21AB51
MNRIVVTCDGVLRLLCSLNIRKATGPDTLLVWVLKEFAVEIAPILTYISQESLDTGDIPSLHQIVVLLISHWMGDKSAPSNLRPVSITSICNNLLEHIIFSNIMKHYNQHDILTEAQHGFRSGRSCETQLILQLRTLPNPLMNLNRSTPLS